MPFARRTQLLIIGPLAGGLLAYGLWPGARRDEAPSQRRAAPVARPARVATVRSYALSPSAHDQCAEVVDKPRMTRWRPLVRRVVGRDPAAYALVMTFIFVESGGRQFAVSRTGCIGLMQFCDRTALRAPFDRIFDIDQLRPCDCWHRRCQVGWQARRLLETSDPPLHQLVASAFPCALSDPRFDPERALRAGWTYIRQLDADFEHNIYLVYIGYNSGPHVAARIWRRLGPRRARQLSAIGRVLRRALRPNFGRRARRRARALLRVHLPKVQRVHQAFLLRGDAG